MNSEEKPMFTRDVPSRAELPSTRQLMVSTLLAAVGAVVLLCAVVLPAEYGIDPTGIGRVLGLTDMGETKRRLAQQAAQEAAATQTSRAEPAAPAAPSSPSAPSAPAASGPAWRDETTFTLAPGQGTEIKLTMKEGETARYAWTVQGGVVNFDTHGDGPGRSIRYAQGRGAPSEAGELTAAFSGNHGWFWRNRGQQDVTVVLRTGGVYSDIRRLK